jgi:DNA-binding transcriptional regulator YhcF (GntR family)
VEDIKKVIWDYIYSMIQKGYTKDKAKEYLKQIIDKM